MKNEFQVIADLIEKDKKVLDVGCADGTLMKFLKDNKNINIRGLEISKEKVQECIAKGLTVIEGNAEKDLKQFPDKSFDYVQKHYQMNGITHQIYICVQSKIFFTL